MADAERTSYREIVRSSFLIGGSSAINVGLGIVRTKVLAVLIGTSGMGLFGAFSSVVNLVGGVAAMGISTSGVRQISDAVGTNDAVRISRTALVLRRTSLVMGALGMVVLAVLSRTFSRMTFGTVDYAVSIAVLSLTILFNEISAGQAALLQGMRRLRDLAAMNVWGALLGTGASIVLVYYFRERGIVPFFVCVSAFAILCSWWYARKVTIEKVPVPPSVVLTEGKALLGLGLVFMASGLMTNAVAYLTRVLVIRQMSLDAAGLFQSAWALSSTYVGFVMTAMGADYFPRLTAVASDHTKVNRLVNEQTEAALLMAVPGILGTMTFAPWVLHLLYSAKFAPAVGILRWQLLGILGRVVAWPLGFVLPAKGCAQTWFLVELGANLVHLAFVFIGLRWFGLDGLGVAFFGLYVVYLIAVRWVMGNLTGFSWSRSNIRLGIASAAVCGAVFYVNVATHPPEVGLVLGGLTTVGAALFALRQLARRSGYYSPTEVFRALAARFQRRRSP